VLGLNLLGDALRDATDPTLSHGKDPMQPPRGSIRHVPGVVS
jgi:peptide/nickel transport system permease protein